MVFLNNSRHQQNYLACQLAVALARLGSFGGGASIARLQTLFGLSAGTVVAYTERVVQALIDMAQEWVAWPDRRRRRELGIVMEEEGFPGCVGFVDGTGLALSQKPTLDGEAYFDRKKRLGSTSSCSLCNSIANPWYLTASNRYSVSMQVVCDDKRIIGMHAGCPGSCADSSVFKRMSVYCHPGEFFSKDEYMGKMTPTFIRISHPD